MKSDPRKTIPHRDLNAWNAPFAPRERRTDDRRKTKDKGYMYISMVGWIDRREGSRRDGDTYLFRP